MKSVRVFIRQSITRVKSCVGNIADKYSERAILLCIFSPLIWMPLSNLSDVFGGNFYDALPGIVSFVCGTICAVVSVNSPNTPARPGVLSAIVLIGLVVVGIWGTSRGLSILLPEGDASFIDTNRARWEVVALLSTGFMAGIYFDALDDIDAALKKHNKHHQGKVVRLVLLGAVYCMYQALAHLHELEVHYRLVVTVTVLFLIIDLWISWRLGDSTDNEIKSLAADSRSLLVMLDWPVLVGLVILGVYLSNLHCPTDALSKEVVEGMTNKDVSSNPCVEVYPFLAGAIAFQMISFNIIYVFFTFKFLKHDQKNEEKNTVLSV